MKATNKINETTRTRAQNAQPSQSFRTGFSLGHCVKIMMLVSLFACGVLAAIPGVSRSLPETAQALGLQAESQTPSTAKNSIQAADSMAFPSPNANCATIVALVAAR